MPNFPDDFLRFGRIFKFKVAINTKNKKTLDKPFDKPFAIYKEKRLLHQKCNSLILSVSFVIPLRFERKTHALEGRCSIQLSYGTILNCAAKVRTFVETCKQNRKNLFEKELILDFLLVHFGSTQDVFHKIVGFTTSEVAILADGIIEILFITL